MSSVSLQAKLKALQHVALERCAYVAVGENDFYPDFARTGGNVLIVGRGERG